jgi:ribonuclease HI
MTLDTIDTLDVLPTLPVIKKIHFHGLCEPTNPGGHATWAWIAYTRTGREIVYGTGYIGVGPGMTHNIATYTALVRALTWLRDTYGKTETKVWFISDNQLIIKQMQGEYGVRSDVLVPLHLAAQELRSAVNVGFQWDRLNDAEPVKRYSTASLPEGVHPRMRRV